MSEYLGKKIPENILSIISPDKEDRLNSAVFLITVDTDGSPRSALLSPYQICSVSEGEFFFTVYKGSHTSMNLEENGKSLFIFQIEGGVTYIRCISEVMPQESIKNYFSDEILFLASDLEVSRDFSEKARITSVTSFDQSSVQKNYTETFRQIRKMAKGWKS